MRGGIAGFVLALVQAAAAFAAGPGVLQVEIHQPTPNQVLAASETSIEVVGGASIYGGVKQLDLFLVMDTSKSLSYTDADDRRTAGAVGLIRSLPAESDIQIGVVDFDGNTELLSPLTADRLAVIEALRRLDQKGTTNLADGIRTALDGLSRARPGSSRVILLFTDGKSNEKKARAAMLEAKRRGVAIHTLLLGSDDGGESILREIAEETGGSFVRVVDPGRLPEAFLALRTTGVDKVTLRAGDSPPTLAALVGGTFSGRVPLSVGTNRIVASATSLLGEMRETEVSVVVRGRLRVSIDSPADGALFEERQESYRVEGSASAFGDLAPAMLPSDRDLGVSAVSLSVNGAPPVPALLEAGRFRTALTLSEGENRIVATALGRDGERAEHAIRVNVNAPGCAELQVEATQAGKPALSLSDRAVVLVIDASNSMWGRMQGLSKMEVARSILTDAVDWLPQDLALGLRAYGHRHPHERKHCEDSELLVPFGAGSRDGIRFSASGLKPRGQTPIAYALRQTAGDFAGFRGERAVVLITDGIESCGGNPVAAARALQRHGPIPVHVIGFGLASGEDEDPASLRAIAAASGGRYVTARSAEELREALSVTVGTPFRVRLGERTVAAGTLGGDDPIWLPAGDYTVRFESAPPYAVPVTLAREAGLTLMLKRDGRKVFHARKPHEVAYRACELPQAPAPAAPEPGVLWEELPDAEASPAPAQIP